MPTKKNEPKPSFSVIMATRKNINPPRSPIVLMTTQKTNNYWIPFIVNVTNDYHNNSKAMKRRQHKYIYCEGACGHKALWNFKLRFEPLGLPSLKKSPQKEAWVLIC